MTRVTVDASTAAKLNGLGEYLEFYDEAGNLLGRFEPNEKSPAFREWLRNLDDGLSDEEVERRIISARREGITTDQVIARLRGPRP
jgi:hypothetical protein